MLCVCLCVRQRLRSHSLDLTLKNSSRSLQVFFPSTQLCFRFCFLTGNVLLFSLSVSSSVPVVMLTTDTFMRAHGDVGYTFQLAWVKHGGRNFSPQTCNSNRWCVPGLRIFTGQYLMLRSLCLNPNLLCSVFPSFENGKGIFPE